MPTYLHQIENRKLYNVHRYFFQRDSVDIFSLYRTESNFGEDNVIALRGIISEEFDLFLFVLYPMYVNVEKYVPAI